MLQHILDQNAGPEYLPAKYVDMLSEHTQKNAQMVEKKRIGDIHSKILAKKSFVLPALFQTKEGIALSGAALFRGKDNRLVTILPAKDTASLNYMTGSQVRGIFTISMQKQPITYEFQRVHHRMKLDIKNPKHPNIDIYVTVDGKFSEIHPSLYRHFSVEQLHNLLAKKMTEQLQSTIQRIQKQYKLDVLGIGDVYQRKDYKKWKTIFHYMSNPYPCKPQYYTLRFYITKIVHEEIYPELLSHDFFFTPYKNQ